MQPESFANAATEASTYLLLLPCLDVENDETSDISLTVPSAATVNPAVNLEEGRHGAKGSSRAARLQIQHSRHTSNATRRCFC